MKNLIKNLIEKRFEILSKDSKRVTAQRAGFYFEFFKNKTGNVASISKLESMGFGFEWLNFNWSISKTGVCFEKC